MRFRVNPLLKTDSYKISHHNQRPPATTVLEAYLEGRYNHDGVKEMLPFGLEYILEEHFSEPFTRADIDDAAVLLKEHFFGNGKVFNEAGFREMLDLYNGYWPLHIKAIPEGIPIPHRNVLMTVKNTDPRFNWATTYVEGLLMQQWYPMSVATYSREVKKIQLAALELTGTPADILYKFHDFGFRGTSSAESAMIGGMAHLVNYNGTDTLVAVDAMRHYYKAIGAVGHSIPAMEHSTVTPWGQVRELLAYENMLDQYPEGPVAIVIDSYDWRDAIRMLGSKLRDKVLHRNGVLVLRPDSGKPEEVVPEVIEIAMDCFGYVTNSKFYKVLDPHVRVIQGDGIKKFEIINRIYAEMFKRRQSADNIAFGCGNGLLQDRSRDEHGMAMKCNSAVIDGKKVPVSKNPFGDPLKASKAGSLKLVLTDEGLQTVSEDAPGEDRLVDRYINGQRFNAPDIYSIRERAKVECASGRF